MMEPILPAVPSGFDEFLERRCVGAHHFQQGALGHRDIRGDPDGLDRHALLGFLIEPERALAPGQSGEQFDSLQHTAEEGDVAIEMTRRMPDDRE